MTFRTTKARLRPKAPARSAAHEETAWRLANIRDLAVQACDAFASRVEARNGYLSERDSETWEHLIAAVRAVDSAIDILAPRVPASSNFQNYAGFRSALPKPPRVSPADRDWS
jgi:hypothetical protein